jgi:ribonucleases P/MRP protein subunit RPP40
VLESLIKDEMLAHLKKHGLIKRSQHGFLPGRSCTTNLLEFLEKATLAADNGEAFDAIFLDFAKAFDKVPHARLLKKLQAHGITGRLFRWVENWLTGRRQTVVLGGEFSTWIEVLSGVPQGSVLGPLLFLIFINYIDEAASAVEIIREFADDTKIGRTIRDEHDRQRLQEALDNLTKWSEKWGMEFNVKKCKVVHFGRSNNRGDYKMLGETLTKAEVERDIGVEVHQSLKPSMQCAKAAATAKLILSQITRSFHYRDRHTFLKLYKTYVRPHLEFSTPAWPPWSQTDKKMLEKVQEKFVNMISGLSGRTYEEKLSELQLDRLEDRRQLADMVMVHKIMHGHGDLTAEHWFDRFSTERLTRAASDPLNIKSRGGRLDIRSGFFSNRVVKDWNEVPSDIKSLPDQKKFKSVYRWWIKTQGTPAGATMKYKTQ